MKNFNELLNQNLKTLDLYVPIVDRVHGGSHPEFHEVKRLYDELREDLGKEDPQLHKHFEELKEVTNNYTVPTDVCESYEAVYKLLEGLDEAYKAKN